ncbi:crooked neck-like protein 1, partial [Tanacetum coccineum]
GNAIGIAPKDKIFKKYIEIKLQLGNMDHCRKLYEKYLEWSPENCYAWSKYAELERSLIETERARAIFELAIAQPALDMPELLWKAYINFEIAEWEFERTRQLYERLLDRTKHLKVWISYAKFEASAIEEVEQLEELSEDLKEERAILLEEWLNMESGFGELGDIELVRVKLPKKLKKRRQIEIDDGPAGYEEYIDYLFPEESQASNLKILEQAYKWKKQKVAYDDEDENDDMDD